ncbi:MAG: OmpH family outer membrane protein [Prevotellaceae bacterium]|jgi:outer membrane protein|nr:OmpH family outer membrane protein [Prevotellaceae bacterium]
MRKFILLIALLVATTAAKAQQFAFIDTEYILENIPAYAKAAQQLDESSKKWQAAIEAKAAEAKKLYENYQSKAASMTDAQRSSQENAIVAKEKEIADLRQQYFGQDGEMAKLEEKLLAPIHDSIYEAVKQVAEDAGYDAVIDRATAQSVIFASPRIDVSDDVLAVLGYSN